MYRPSQKMREQILEPQGYQQKLIGLTNARRLLWGYVKANELELGGGKQVLVDPTLREAVFSKGDRWGSGECDKVSKKDLALSLTKSMKIYHCILFEDDGEDEVDESMYKTGPPPDIMLCLGARQGNKVVTLVEGLEPWDIEAKELASMVRKKHACSTTTLTASRSKQKKDIQIVQAQGNLLSEIKGYLSHEYGVPGQFINVSQKTTKAPKKTKSGEEVGGPK